MTASHNFVYQFKVPFHQVDRAGVLFFGHLFTHAHDAYEQFLTHLDISLDRNWMNSTYRLPIVHAEANYHLPLAHGMTVDVNMNISRLGRTSFTTTYEFMGLDRRCYARVEIVHCCVDNKTNSSSVLPTELRLLLESYHLTPPPSP